AIFVTTSVASDNKLDFRRVGISQGSFRLELRYQRSRARRSVLRNLSTRLIFLAYLLNWRRSREVIEDELHFSSNYSSVSSRHAHGHGIARIDSIPGVEINKF